MTQPCDGQGQFGPCRLHGRVYPH
ncbi:hypothetical protein F383_04377 [Gossypium arboreum]|uniref:Uncharacterized protein n=1 Tax=Gossypium arboreum TaxID=29729 RepID=A0A0B0NUT4_GOSAR|nr:hypothetical protein F383_04377 [Gossypium arboreum]